MERKYVQVRPSREKLNPDDLVSHISSLHKLTNHGQRRTIKSRLNPLEDSSEDVPQFEFLAISQGKDSPVEFFYGTNEDHLNALKNRLTTAYPASFDVEIVDVDVLQKIIPPEKYAPEDFVKKLENGHLLFDPDATGTAEDIEGDHTGSTIAGEEENSVDSPASGDDFNNQDPAVRANGGEEQATSPADKTDMLSLEVDRPSETTQPREEDAVTERGEEVRLSPEQIDGYDMLEELNAGLLDLVELPDELDGDYLETQIEGPTWTEDGDILARPTLEHGEPVAARWDGSGERKKDWMTTMKMFSKVARPGADDIQDRAPLATLIQHLADSDLPIAFQVCFKRIEDWSRQAERRKDNLHLNRDTLGQKVMYELGEILHAPSVERRRERMRDYMEDIGESADMNAESPIAGDVGKRRKLIDNKIPKRTFRANIRAVSVANDEVPVADVERTMDDLASVLDHIDGYFYGLEPTILKDGEGYRRKKKATEEFHRLVNREIVSGSGKARPDVVVNADELANFITVPSSENLTVEGVRGTRAEAEARDPLPKPDPDLMREFHAPGMRIGYALDKEAEREPVPTQVPPGLLTTHYGRFATTGAGKSKALINDILSLHENTNGPIILIDPKGDGMTENYMKAHFERFGEENFKENVIHYPIPDILPGFTFFNIEPALDQGMRRGDAIQNKADHYQELLKLVMGREKYEESKVAPTMISALIKALFDEHYVEKKRRDNERGEDDTILGERGNPNKFTHRHLEKLTKQVRMYGADEGGEIPEVSDEAVKDTLEEQAEGDSRTFSTIMNAVFNRLNYIREDQHLRQIFNNTEEKFDFRDHLYDNKVILFDLGDLRDDATMIMTGLILTNLWDALQEADRTVCTQGHNTIEDCREKARKNGLDPTSPRCREPWPDDHLVNIIIDEAASVAVSSIMDKMLEQGRSFHLSVGLSMQFPEQMKGAGTDRTYKNVLNNIGTKLIGKITLDEEIAKAMAHEGMDVEEFNNRISALPRGEWIAQLPSPNFMETGPEPFSLQPLPIPAGHPESKNVLTEEAEQRFDHFLANQVHRRTEEEFGVDRDKITYGKSNPDEDANEIGTEGINVGADETEDTEDTSPGEPSSGDDSDEDDIALGDHTLPGSVVGDADENDTADDGSGTEPGTAASVGSEAEAVAAEPVGEGEEAAPSAQHTTGTGDGSAAEALLNSGITENEEDVENLPSHIGWHDPPGVYECLVCGKDYYPKERQNVFTCCETKLRELRDRIGDPSRIKSVANTDGYVTSTEQYLAHDDKIRTFRTTVRKADTEFEPGNEPVLKNDDEKITRVEVLPKLVGNFDETTVGSVVSKLVAETPPEHQYYLEEFVDWYIDGLRNHKDKLDDSIRLNEPYFRELIYETPPADFDIDIEEVLQWVADDVDTSVITRWNNVGCDPLFKRFYSGRLSVPNTKLSRTGRYGAAYSPSIGLGTPVEPAFRSPASYDLPTANDDTSGGEESVPVKKVSAADLLDEHLEEYGVTREEAGFMRAVVMAMNGELEGYDLTESMSGTIKSLYSIDEDKLKEKGYLKRHVGVRNRVYYTVTNAGQDACGIKKKHGREIGDLGDDTPHRVGVELTRDYYMSMPSVRRVELSPKQDGSELDLAVYDDNGNMIAVVEVEGGRTSADSDVADDASSGINDYDSIRKDYELLANSEGESVWVVRNHEVAVSVLRALKSSDEIDLPIDDQVLKQVEDRKMSMTLLNDDYISELDSPGVDKVLTYKQLRNRIQDTDEDE